MITELSFLFDHFNWPSCPHNNFQRLHPLSFLAVLLSTVADMIHLWLNVFYDYRLMIRFLCLYWLRLVESVFEFQPGLWVISFIINDGSSGGLPIHHKPHSDYSLPKPHNTPLQNTPCVKAREIIQGRQQLIQQNKLHFLHKQNEAPRLFCRSAECFWILMRNVCFERA